MSTTVNPSPSYLLYLQDGGEMGELTRSYDWSKTVLGPPSTWSQSLLTTLSILLKSKFPMFLWWGEELIQFYNDAYRPSLGNEGKHPSALGQRGENCWPEIWPEIKPMIDQVMITGVPTWDEDRLIPIYRNGHLEDVYWTFSYSQVTDGLGKEGGVLVICNETTEKVKSLQSLVEMKEGLRTEQKAAKNQRDRIERFLMQAPVGICVLDGENLVYELVNPLYQQLFPERDLLGKPLFEAVPELKDQPLAASLKEVYNTGITYEGNELLIPLLNRESAELEDRYFNFIYQARLDRAGAIDGIIACAVEVTEMLRIKNKIAESEMRFRSLINAIPQIAWTSGLDGKVDFYNQRWYEYTGLTHEESKNWDWKDLVHPDDVQPVMEAYRAILTAKTQGKVELREKSADGTYRWHQVCLQPLRDANNEVQNWIGTATDIHDLKLLQEQKDDFISIASHELKTPITALTASFQLLNRMKNDPVPGMMPSLIERANKNLNKVNLLIKDLLNATQFSKGQLHLHKTDVVLADLVGDCCTHVLAENEFSIKLEGDLSLTVFADLQRIEQVIVNFVNNAIKYAPQSKEIVIALEKIDDKAKVSVRDKGDGIPEAKIPFLFDRYFRVNETASKHSGLGLGLYISKEIIKSHGGELGVTSEMGKGSTFWFTLPC